MSVENASLLTGPTITVTGGTAQTFAIDGTVVNRGVQIADTAEADVRTRDVIVFKNVSGAMQTNGTWSKDRRSAKFVSPDLLPDGTQDFPFFEISLVKSPLWTQAKLDSMKEKAVQLLTDADFASFWQMGSLK